MPFGKSNPFSANPFATDAPKLVEVPSGPSETHERHPQSRRYLSNANLSDAIGSALSPLLPGAPRSAKKVEVERIREVDRVPSAGETPILNAGTPPKWGRDV